MILPSIAILISLLSFVVAWQGRVDGARAELLEYLARIVQLDRAATRRNGHLINALAQQCDAIVRLHKPWQLRLSPTVYRMLGEYLLLDTDELSAASNMLERGIRSARRRNNNLELIRCRRAQGELAAAQFDPKKMRELFDSAINLAESRASDTQPAIRASKNRTYAFGIFAALVANEHNHSNPEWAQIAREYSAQLGDGMAELRARGSLEVARRAHRLKHPTPPEFEEIQLTEWQQLWDARDPSGAA